MKHKQQYNPTEGNSCEGGNCAGPGCYGCRDTPTEGDDRRALPKTTPAEVPARADDAGAGPGEEVEPSLSAPSRPVALGETTADAEDYTARHGKETTR